LDDDRLLPAHAELLVQLNKSMIKAAMAVKRIFPSRISEPQAIAEATRPQPTCFGQQGWLNKRKLFISSEV
jgi:hypothetical protein